MIPLVLTGVTPAAFSRALSDRADSAATSAAGFGTATLQDVQAIDAKVVKLLAENASKGTGEAPVGNVPAGTPELRAADLPRLMRAALQQAATAAAAGQGQPKLTPESVLMMFSMQLSAVLTEENNRNLAAQLALMKLRLAARAATAAELADAIKLAQAVVDAAMGDAGAAEGELAAALEALKQAEAEVARLEQALAGAPPEEQDALRAQLEAAKANVAAQNGKVDVAHAKLNAALTTLNNALADLESFKSEADKLDPNQSISARGDADATTNQARLGELLAILQQLINDASLRKMTEDTKFVQAMLKAREAENMRRAEEYEAEVKKAEEAQKKMGCIGKILGWVVTVVAVVAAPFTGGASMALAGIGLALAIGEELGLDVMGKIMEPIMKLVMKLVKEMSNIIGSVLKTLGVPEDIVDKIKDVLGVIAVAAMIVAVFFISKKAAGTAAVQAITKAVTKAVTEAISKALPAIIKAAAHTVKQSVDDVAKAISNTVAKVVGSNSDTLAVRAGYATTASHVAQFTNQTAQGVGAVIIADMYVNAAELMAKLELGMADSALFRDLIQKILDYYLQTQNLVDELFKDMTDVQAIQDNTAKFITAGVARA